jgi:DNA-binding LytR/AlgR family response regulator
MIWRTSKQVVELFNRAGLSTHLHHISLMETITLLDRKGRRTVELHRIEYLTGVGNYSLFHIKGEKPILIATTLKTIALRLPGFLRIHKKTLVNPAHITSYQLSNRHDSVVKLSGERLLPVSRRRAEFTLSQLESVA